MFLNFLWNGLAMRSQYLFKLGGDFLVPEFYSLGKRLEWTCHLMPHKWQMSSFSLIRGGREEKGRQVLGEENR